LQHLGEFVCWCLPSEGLSRPGWKRLLAEHTDAWNSHDLDRLMELFTDDCVFEASGGNNVHGQRFEGRAAVSDAFAAVFDKMFDAPGGWAATTSLAPTTAFRSGPLWALSKTGARSRSTGVTS
jgi:uncharacterized protein (TIGR02246 family)